MIRRFALMAATAAMAAAPVTAHAAPQRQSAPVSADSEQLFGSPIFLILLIAVVVGLGVVVASDSDDPVSP